MKSLVKIFKMVVIMIIVTINLFLLLLFLPIFFSLAVYDMDIVLSFLYKWRDISQKAIDKVIG